MLKAKHKTVKVGEDYRLIAISDIHGHLDFFIELLDSIHYKVGEDYLVIIGDYVEKGDQVLETMTFIEKLSHYPRVYILMGNCEWAMTAMLTIPELAPHISHYLNKVSANGAIRTLMHQKHLDFNTHSSLSIQHILEQSLHTHLQFIKHLPVTLKFNDFIFVHAGLEPRDNYKECGLSSYLEMQRFLDYGHPFKETVIVGHIPVSNYKNIINNDIIFDFNKRIISIDGGIGVKPIAQLNALIINSIDGKISYQTAKYQPLPQGILKRDIEGNHLFHKISFPDFEVKILEKKESFSLCQQVNTHIILDIKNEYLYQRDGHFYCLDDYTDHMISGNKGDPISILLRFKDYDYVLCNEQTGWVEDKDVRISEKK
ncbi:metallophosphoesterase [Eggerthia catenaformis]|uniref:metallophosphoesterase family protein n=1 Tax=Eggerthia catenaformis TaxID=31973 RepID=UPI0028E95A8C|nr:metallophosphoesterase [Eggerthia catenaformis]